MTGDWQRLAQYAMRRRAELGLTQLEVAQRGPLSLDRVQSVEGAKRDKYRLGTLLALERALQWEADSVEAILAGGVPTVRVPVGAVEQLDPALPVRRIVEGRATVGAATAQASAHDATVTTIEGRAAARLEEISQKVGLADQPPFPNPTSKTQQAANALWQAYRLLVEDDPSDATVRGVIRRGAVDLEELQEREKLRGSG